MEIKDIVISFLRNNGCDLKCTGGFIRSLIHGHIQNEQDDSIRTIEDVITAFGRNITDKEKKEIGAIYTPKFIRDYMCSLSVSPVLSSYIDVSCGCGSFLYSVVETLVKRFNFNVNEALDMVYGIDIQPDYVVQTKSVLALYAWKETGKYIGSNDMHVVEGDALDLLVRPFFNRTEFDVVIGNPPYVSASNMPKELLDKVNHINKTICGSLSNSNEIRYGKAELYLSFFYVALYVLSDNGRVMYITPNSWLNSQNGVLFRKMLENEVSDNLEVVIRDFGNNKVFGSLGVYSCITEIRMKSKDVISYTTLSIGKDGIFENEPPYKVPVSELDSMGGWSLTDSGSYSFIQKIEKQPRHLSDYKIKNGIATNANDVFILKSVSGDCDYYATDNGLMIETGITRKIVKASKLKCEKDIEDNCEIVIFPYDKDGKIIPEDIFKNCYPNAYSYLRSYKERLDERDKGKKDYPAWYAFARSQAIRDRGMKLIFPQMSDKPYFVFSDDEELMFYSGGAIYGDDREELLRLKMILESPVMEFYIKSVSKPYSSNFYSYGERYFGKFGIPDITEDEWNLMSILEKGEELDRFICEKYGINYKNLKMKLS